MINGTPELTFHVDTPFAADVDVARLAALAERVRESEGPPGELCVRVVGDETIRDLNLRFRDTDVATDVLSFGMTYDASDSGAFVTPPGSPAELGEVVISYPTAARQAADAGHPVNAELEHLLVHGILHLLGYDHQTDAAAQLMHAREEAILGRAVHGGRG